MENSNEKKKISIAKILEMQSEGKLRKDVQEYYALSDSEMKELFKHPKIKGKRFAVKKESTLDIVDDTEESKSSNEEENRFNGQDGSNVSSETSTTEVDMEMLANSGGTGSLGDNLEQSLVQDDGAFGA